MFNKKIIISAVLLLFAFNAAYCAPTSETQIKPEVKVTAPAPKLNTSPLEIVANPTKFLHKNFIMDAKFDKFSTLGLDYKKAMRDSHDYIGILIQRDDVKDHNIPLSELKLFVKRDYAEKFVDLNTGDKIKISGEVFSTALGDAWADIKNIEVVEKVKKEEK